MTQFLYPPGGGVLLALFPVLQEGITPQSHASELFFDYKILYINVSFAQAGEVQTAILCHHCPYLSTAAKVRRGFSGWQNTAVN